VVSSKQLSAVLVVSALAGLIGGTAAERLFRLPSAYAQDSSPETLHVKRVFAEQVFVVDPETKAQISLTIDDSGKPVLEIRGGDREYVTSITDYMLGFSIARRLEPGHEGEAGVVHGRVAFGFCGGQADIPELRFLDENGTTVWVAP
jgi:hypothetical protein